MGAEASYIEDVMYGRRKSFVIGTVLRILSVLYGIVIRLRSAGYDHELFSRKRLEQRVISVGNITLGGTGKTPAVIQIAGMLRQHQKRPGVITRGYGRSDESALVVVADGKEILADTRSGGDEPVLIASKLSGVPVIADRNRYRAARYAVNAYGIDTVILDDGFQHRRLRRDLDIVLVDAADPFGNGRLFPAGILREPLPSLRRAHVVLLTGIDRASDPDAVKEEIRRHTRARVFTSRPAPVELVDIMTGNVEPLSSLRDSVVLAFAGIARPAGFVSLLGSLGARVRAEMAYPDHYAYQDQDLAVIRQRAADEKVEKVITTEKDAVRLKSLHPEGIRALRIELKVVEDREWEALLLSTL